MAGWHSETSRQNGPVAANRAAQTLRAVYRRAAAQSRSASKLPTSGVTSIRSFVPVPAVRSRSRISPHGIAPGADCRQSMLDFTLTNLLTGCGPGELSRLRWDDVHEDHFVIPRAKTGDYRVVLSEAISEALEATGTRGVTEPVFRDASRQRTRMP